jgi:NAD(P)-dependent dehydrogenase (short-subunit alcohol dehydrogenase family)
VDHVGEQNAMANFTQILNPCFLHNLDKVLDNVPIKHVGQPEDIASIVSYLASKDAHFITGRFMMSSLHLFLAHVTYDVSRSMCRSI